MLAPVRAAPEAVPADRDVVEAAAEAAEDAVFEAYRPSEIADLDVTIDFTDGELTVDVYLDADADTPEERQREETVAQRATEAAARRVDELFESAE